jgi:hypothetical protein
MGLKMNLAQIVFHLHPNNNFMYIKTYLIFKNTYKIALLMIHLLQDFKKTITI